MAWPSRGDSSSDEWSSANRWVEAGKEGRQSGHARFCLRLGNSGSMRTFFASPLAHSSGAGSGPISGSGAADSRGLCGSRLLRDGAKRDAGVNDQHRRHRLIDGRRRCAPTDIFGAVERAPRWQAYRLAADRKVREAQHCGNQRTISFDEKSRNSASSERPLGSRRRTVVRERLVLPGRVEKVP